VLADLGKIREKRPIVMLVLRGTLLAWLLLLASDFSRAARVTPPPSAVTAATESTADPGSESTTAHKPKIVVLPIDFVVRRLSVAGTTVHEEWTQQAKSNLAGGLELALAERTGAEFVTMPEISLDERAVLDEYVAVAKLIVIQANEIDSDRWATRRADFDRQLGPDLRFLRDRTGADYALLVSGAQSEASAAIVLAQIAVFAYGPYPIRAGKSLLMIALLDLAVGEVRWFNSVKGGEYFGLNAKDFRSPDASARVLTKLAQPYPDIPALGKDPP
jgi:hypothetical protein